MWWKEGRTRQVTCNVCRCGYRTVFYYRFPASAQYSVSPITANTVNTWPWMEGVQAGRKATPAWTRATCDHDSPVFLFRIPLQHAQSRAGTKLCYQRDTCVCLQAGVGASVCVCMQVCVHLSVCACKCVCVQVCVRASVCTCMHLRACALMCVLACVCLCGCEITVCCIFPILSVLQRNFVFFCCNHSASATPALRTRLPPSHHRIHVRDDDKCLKRT